MAIPNPEEIQVLLLFVVPGIIIVFVRSRFLGGRMPLVTDGIILYFSITAAYHALFFPITSIFLDGPPSDFLGMVGWSVFIFLLPALCGVLLGLAIRGRWLKLFLDRLGLTLVHPIGTSWEYVFSNSSGAYVIVCMKDGTKWAGFFGSDSFASSDVGERDILLERVYEICADHTWKPRESAVWLSASEIQSIEFWPKTRG